MRNQLFFLCIMMVFLSCQKKRPVNPPDTVTRLSDEELIDLVERQTFQYFWDGAEPISGMAPERIHIDGVYPQNDQDVIASGGSGFGLMAIIAAIERGYISRKQGVERLNRIADFLERSERFHGVWPHWIYAETAKAKPFSQKDDGGDLVETSYLAQGMICVRQYLQKGNREEKQLADRYDALWRGIDWNWHRGPDQENVLFWHWSPNFGWEMDFRIRGYNECLITYVLAACSPTHGVPVAVYHEGWARNGAIRDTAEAYGKVLTLAHQAGGQFGGPLFWAHYSYLGLDPRNLRDQYADYWEQNVNHAYINYRYCVDNPHDYEGYGENCWGLTSSYSPQGYAGHAPEHDLGVISPTAALSSLPYTPEPSMRAMRYFYEALGDNLWGPYGFYDAFSLEEGWFIQRYLAIDQGPIVVMLENYRSGLLWDLFMSAPEVQQGLEKLGFQYR